MKFTFICEPESGTKVTHEFSTQDSFTVEKKFKQFLKNSFDHDIEDEDSNSVSVFRSMSEDLIKNPPYMDSFSINLDDINFDYMGNMGGSVITGGAGEDTIMSYDKIVVDSNQENCSLCKLPVNVMRMHQCFDPQCPSGAYRREYHSEK